MAFRRDVAAGAERPGLRGLRHRLRPLRRKLLPISPRAHPARYRAPRCAASSRTTISPSTTRRSAPLISRVIALACWSLSGPGDLEAGAAPRAGCAAGRLRGRAPPAFLRHGGDGRSSSSCTSPWWLVPRTFRPCSPAAQEAAMKRTRNGDSSLADHRPADRAVERRLFLRQGLSLGALSMLSGCAITDDDGVQHVLRRCRAGTTACRPGSSTRAARARVPESAITAPIPVQRLLRRGRGPLGRRRGLRARVAGLVREKKPWTLPELYALPQVSRSRATSASRAGARSASGAACASPTSCSASAPTSPRGTSASSAPTTIRPASTWRPRCTRRRC